MSGVSRGPPRRARRGRGGPPSRARGRPDALEPRVIDSRAYHDLVAPRPARARASRGHRPHGRDRGPRGHDLGRVVDDVLVHDDDRAHEERDERSAGATRPRREEQAGAPSARSHAGRLAECAWPGARRRGRRPRRRARARGRRARSRHVVDARRPVDQAARERRGLAAERRGADAEGGPAESEATREDDHERRGRARAAGAAARAMLAPYTRNTASETRIAAIATSGATTAPGQRPAALAPKRR